MHVLLFLTVTFQDQSCVAGELEESRSIVSDNFFLENRIFRNVEIKGKIFSRRYELPSYLDGVVRNKGKIVRVFPWGSSLEATLYHFASFPRKHFSNRFA